MRRTKAEKEQTLNKILELKVAGKLDRQIREELQISQRNYNKYTLMLKDRFTNEMLAQRDEYFSESIHVAIEGMKQDRQVLQDVMNSPKSSPTARVLAAKEDRDTQMFILRTMSEANAWAQSLKQRMTSSNKDARAGVLPGNVIQ